LVSRSAIKKKELVRADMIVLPVIYSTARLKKEKVPEKTLGTF